MDSTIGVAAVRREQFIALFGDCTVRFIKLVSSNNAKFVSLLALSFHLFTHCSLAHSQSIPVSASLPHIILVLLYTVIEYNSLQPSELDQDEDTSFLRTAKGHLGV